jgi:hypothetical protein
MRNKKSRVIAFASKNLNKRSIPMRSSLLLALLALALGSASLASAGEVRVTCGETRYSDLRGIRIEETDLEGQYQIVETLYDSANHTTEERYSPVFGMDEIEKSEFPSLTSWFGYTRTLIRFGRDHYAIEVRDECSSSMTTIDCKESF